MKRVINLFSCLVCLWVCWGCSESSGTEKHQDSRDNIINVRDNVKEIVMDEVLIGRNAQPYLMNDYLLVNDHGSYDKHIHLFDKKTFKYLASTANKGEGPNEIAVMGRLGIDESNRKFYASDHGKLKIFSFDLDSVLADPLYVPKVKINFEIKEFPSDYCWVNDTLSYAVIIKPTGSYGFNQCIGTWNMMTGEIKPMKYVHPEIEKKRVSLGISLKNGMYVECYRHNDLMTICTLDGNLKYNIYGPKWNNEKTNKVRFYSDVVIGNDKIIASASFGRDNFGKDFWSTAFLVFDLDGNYLQTLETGYNISYFCYDNDNNRILMSLDDDIQFAYLDLDGIIN